MEELEEPFTGWQQPPQRENRGHLPLIRSPLSPAHPRGGAGRLPSVSVSSGRLLSLTPTLLPSPFSLPASLISGVSDTHWALHGHWHCDEDGQDPPLSSGACGPLLSMRLPGNRGGSRSAKGESGSFLQRRLNEGRIRRRDGVRRAFEREGRSPPAAREDLDLSLSNS